MSNYNYQNDTANKIILDFENKNIEASVLAATPGAGKTTISQMVISLYLKKYPSSKILVLTHGQNILKNQYLDNLNTPHINIDFSFTDLNNINDSKLNNFQVYIGLPYSVKKMNLSNIDLLIVDECHQFYLKPMVQDIVKILKPKHQLLMTGSPSEFININEVNKKYAMNFISGDELIKKGVFSNVIIDVVPVFQDTDVVENIKNMLSYAKKEKMNLSKIMIATNTIREAVAMTSFLTSNGRKVALSTINHDPEGNKVSDFKNNKYDTLIVVNRGVLGFSDDYLTGVFDLKRSRDLDTSNQLFSRVLRKHPDNITKFYYRYGNKITKDFNNQAIMLYKIKGLMGGDIYRNYNGKNLKVTYA